MDLEHVLREGYAAFESGIKRHQNPYYELGNMPKIGKSVEQWQRKVAAWEAGWDAAKAKHAKLEGSSKGMVNIRNSQQ